MPFQPKAILYKKCTQSRVYAHHTYVQQYSLARTPHEAQRVSSCLEKNNRWNFIQKQPIVEVD